MHEAAVCGLSSVACHGGTLIDALCSVLQERRTLQSALSLAAVMQVDEAGSRKDSHACAGVPAMRRREVVVHQPMGAMTGQVITLPANEHSLK